MKYKIFNMLNWREKVCFDLFNKNTIILPMKPWSKSKHVVEGIGHWILYWRLILSSFMTQPHYLYPFFFFVMLMIILILIFNLIFKYGVASHLHSWSTAHRHIYALAGWVLASLVGKLKTMCSKFWGCFISTWC